ncbi:TadE family protein [Chengkuizengella axinellae]|uniref:Pilus assembly protein n=1 Tax=Chengkuizengella axinellae TaxID=3064388 RepID=A0ABT9IXK3_9BACL|nr:TadE family protein [Chengkuizengella sp. 2205SS18-9]MDP5274099.1 pilus assembly protein [Chengkuizengella sp. 2205SS18-9]
MKKKIISIFKQQKGSFTLESAMIFPLIFTITISTIFLSLFFYQKAILYSHASLTAERASFNWDNSHKDTITGKVNLEMNDELYWRAFQDSVSQIFPFGVSDEEVALELPLQNQTTENSLIFIKMKNAAKLLPNSLFGIMFYSNDLLSRKISVELNRIIHIPNAVQIHDHVNEKVESSITEPVEFIRNIDLLRSFIQELKLRKVSQEQVKNAFYQFFDFESPPSFARHDDAAVFLRKLVNGAKEEFETTFGKRKIDAMDNSGIAQQAFLTFNESQLRSQMLKDIELLNQGETVKGVVWHFFRKDDQTGKVGPSSAFIQELERNGIVVVIHD